MKMKIFQPKDIGDPRIWKIPVGETVIYAREQNGDVRRGASFLKGQVTEHQVDQNGHAKYQILPEWIIRVDRSANGWFILSTDSDYRHPAATVVNEGLLTKDRAIARIKTVTRLDLDDFLANPDRPIRKGRTGVRVMMSIGKQPSLSPGDIVWYRKARKGSNVFHQVEIKEIIPETGKTRTPSYFVNKTETVELTENGAFRKYTRQPLSGLLKVFTVESKLFTFAELNSLSMELSGQPINLSSPKVLKATKELPIPQKFKTEIKEDPSVEWAAFFKKETTGNIRRRIIATAKRFDKDVWEVGSRIKNMVGTQISPRLLDSLIK